MKETLNKVGANLDDDEFNTLMDRVDANKDGKIELHEFDDYLADTVAEQAVLELNAKRTNLSTHSRFSKTFESNECLYGSLQPAYDRISITKEYREENMRWSKVKHGLQDKRVAVLRAFQESALDSVGRNGICYSTKFSEIASNLKHQRFVCNTLRIRHGRSSAFED